MNLLFFQRQRVLHRIGLRLRFEHGNLRAAFCLLDLPHLRRFRLELRRADLFLLHLELDRQPIVLLRLHQQLQVLLDGSSERINAIGGGPLSLGCFLRRQGHVTLLHPRR